jgi:phosphoribosyl-AMP cyclohydrolase
MAAVDESLVPALRFGADGLIGAIVADAATGEVLMFAHMNGEAVRLTQATGLAHFYSRSRGKLWQKGETSGETLKVAEIRVDCDQDCLLILATPQGKGAACHTGRKSCFYRRLEGERLVMVDDRPLFDPAKVYGKA